MADQDICKHKVLSKAQHFLETETASVDSRFWQLGTSTTRNSTFNESSDSATCESPYRVVFKQQMRMQRLSFADSDRAVAVPEVESDSDDGECENDVSG